MSAKPLVIMDSTSASWTAEYDGWLDWSSSTGGTWTIIEEEEEEKEEDIDRSNYLQGFII